MSSDQIWVVVRDSNLFVGLTVMTVMTDVLDCCRRGCVVAVAVVPDRTTTAAPVFCTTVAPLYCRTCALFCPISSRFHASSIQVPYRFAPRLPHWCPTGAPPHHHSSSRVLHHCCSPVLSHLCPVLSCLITIPHQFYTGSVPVPHHGCPTGAPLHHHSSSLVLHHCCSPVAVWCCGAVLLSGVPPW
jgi:hypothetical protein